jgi:hypothetical protein
VPKKRKFGEIDFPERELVKKRTGIGRLDLILNCDALVPEDMSTLSLPALNFTNKTIKPVLGCLKNHCGGSNEEFIRRWGTKFSYSRFFEKCKGEIGKDCSGK